MGIADNETRPMSITCATSGAMIRMTLQDEGTGRLSTVEVESNELTTVLAEHLMMQELTLETLYGVHDIANYRYAMFTAIMSVARCSRT